MPEDDSNKFGASFAFEYIKLLKKILFCFIGLRSYFSCPIKKYGNVRAKNDYLRFLCYTFVYTVRHAAVTQQGHLERTKLTQQIQSTLKKVRYVF